MTVWYLIEDRRGCPGTNPRIKSGAGMTAERFVREPNATDALRPARHRQVPWRAPRPSPRAPTGDRRAALPVVTVDLHLIPHAVEVVRIAAREGVHGRAVPGVDDVDAADRGLAVVGDERARRHHVDVARGGLVEMHAVGAIELGPRRQDVRLVDGVDHEQHGGPPGAPSPGRAMPV